MRSRIDIFLQYWLTMRTQDEVKAEDIFRIFVSYAGPHMPALRYFLPPPRIVKLGPMGNRPLLDSRPNGFTRSEDPVLDQIGLQQRSSTIVQGLEDQLCVIVTSEVDRDEYQSVLQCGGQRFDAQSLGARRNIPVVIRFAAQPTSSFSSKEFVSIQDSVLAITGRRRVHGCGKGQAIGLRRPELEPFALVYERLLLVEDEAFQRLCKIFVTTLVDHLLDCVKQQLQGSHALLTVDDLMTGHVAGDRRPCLVNHRAEKVLSDCGFCARFLCCNIAFCDPEHVVPQRCPLIFFIPDIRPLKGGDLVMFFALEQHSGATGMRFHASGPHATDAGSTRVPICCASGLIAPSEIPLDRSTLTDSG
ncbi:hypothetical protein A5642_12355 [Mycolicibacterium mucogenicum]|uniref:Uncharacterized protein n=1 Tax=Mycolicibacterium mucogenicum TaxID=56689 RepID=A0A1A0MYU1_MYCMU|nr:hypothetical protein A5642_12355 [Mycolicibacterium mucogenicum]